jgi:hypothetical protein
MVEKKGVGRRIDLDSHYLTSPTVAAAEVIPSRIKALYRYS